MHELPSGLTKSLRSFRGSVYGKSPKHLQDDDDLEKGHEDYGEKSYQDEALSPAQSSIILHPTHSSHGLRQQDQQHRQPRYQQVTPQPPSSPPPQQQQQYLQSHLQHQYQQQALHDVLPAQSNLQEGQPFKGTEKVANKRQATFDAPPQTPASAKRSLFSGPKVADPDPAADRLDDETTPLTKDDFYELMGMRPPIARGQLPKHLGLSNGLYTLIHGKFEYVQTKYRIFDVFTYIFLALQILLSAVFIVLGSLTKVDSHIAIAVLGAVSTVIAGILALMKGQGLPNRLRQVRDDLRNVLFEADELYWDVAAGRSVYYKDIRKIREDYLRVMEEARRNHPDTWTRTTTEIAHGLNMRPSKAGPGSNTAAGAGNKTKLATHV